MGLFFTISWLLSLVEVLKIKINRKFLKRVFIVLAIFIFGFAYQYNVDWFNYEKMYLREINVPDRLFEIFMRIGNIVGLDYWEFQFVIVLVSIIVYFKLLYTLDKNNFFLIFLANLPSFYTLNSGIIRQNLAITFCYLILLIKNKYLKIIFLIGSLFIHKSAIIFVIVYFIGKYIKYRKSYLKYILMFIIISFMLLMLSSKEIYNIFSPIFNLIPIESIREKLYYNLDKILNYSFRSSKRVFLKSLEMLSFIIILYFKNIKLDKKYNLYLIFAFSYIIINSIFNLEGTFLRIGLYFEIFYYYFFINYILESIKQKQTIKIVLFIYFLFLSSFSYPKGIKYQYYNYIIHNKILKIENPRGKWIKLWWKTGRNRKEQERLLQMEVNR